MSITAAMFSGVSGLSAQSQAMGMIADNISNINTVAYKATHPQFSTLVTDGATATSYSPGGVRSTPHSMIDKQGLLQSTASVTDMAISGNGFFVVSNMPNPGGSTGGNYLWTRSGNFEPDHLGRLRNASGHYLQGWPIDANGDIPVNRSDLTALDTINVTGLTGNAESTTAIDIKMNLSSTQPVYAGAPAYAAGTGQMSSGAITPHFERSFQVFDSVGGARTITYGFLKTGTNQWAVEIYGDTNGDGLNNSIEEGQVVFNTDGSLNAAASDITAAANEDITINWDPALGIDTPQVVSFNYGTDGQTDGVTQFASSSELISADVNGSLFGNFNGVFITDEGIVTAQFDNGTSKAIYKIPLATFANPNAMRLVEGNAYDETPDSGEFTLREAGVGGAGFIQSSALEASTVDLAEEFSNMIITQRSYSAAGKIISTSDQMLEELLRLKR